MYVLDGSGGSTRSIHVAHSIGSWLAKCLKNELTSNYYLIDLTLKQLAFNGWHYSQECQSELVDLSNVKMKCYTTLTRNKILTWISSLSMLPTSSYLAHSVSKLLRQFCSHGFMRRTWHTSGLLTSCPKWSNSLAFGPSPDFRRLDPLPRPLPDRFKAGGSISRLLESRDPSNDSKLQAKICQIIDGARGWQFLMSRGTDHRKNHLQTVKSNETNCLPTSKMTARKEICDDPYHGSSQIFGCNERWKSDESWGLGHVEACSLFHDKTLQTDSPIKFAMNRTRTDQKPDVTSTRLTIRLN